MRRETLLKQISRLLLITLCFMPTANSYSQSNENPPYQVKKIFIEAVANVKEEVSVNPYLKVELEKRGFEIVSDASKAHAILSLVAAQAEIVLHDDEGIPPKSLYTYQLTLPDKEIIWKTKIKFVSKQSNAEENEYVAKKIAEKIAKKFGAK